MFRTLDGIGKKYTYRLYISELADGGWMYISRVFNLFSGCVAVALPPVQSPSLRAVRDITAVFISDVDPDLVGSAFI